MKGKKVLITGSGSGIGLAFARAFGKAGATVIVTDVTAELAEKARSELSAAGVDCRAYECNVADRASIARLAERVHQEAGPLDVLVNNAGIGWLGPFEETPDEQWRRIFDVNVFGMVDCIQAFLPAMNSAGGRRTIVNVASLAGFTPTPNMSAYAASKHAVVGLSEVLALELHESAVDVLMVCPGFINTPIMADSRYYSQSYRHRDIEKLQTFYKTKGFDPARVADAVVSSVGSGKPYLCVGPMARTTFALAKLSRRLVRKLTISDSRKAGFIPE